ncbi:Rieske 2Fe-2S domain-containing protein [Antrihabitans sp. YC3-6]|uniref:Rieske 2Fe-2S domain-containing protein n=1 Tax=Antrihabitans stalagmiti TaxID=2799499 RepID=A0A934NMA0_9NOCA|nr:DUF5914 domain-containing protein [Antrihabitans stalagmiti]MBJ8337732.1 Rieske 2Fe-2S domain-containing protein [Antrihabitans stalagmiti]
MSKSRWADKVPLRAIPRIDWASQKTTYREARPDLIAAAAERAHKRPSGNWYVIGASREVRSDRPFGTTVDGVEVVAWRAEDGGLLVGPGACPHLGAPLSLGKVDCGTLRCRWHGLALDSKGAYGWKPFPSYDDGILVWVRLDTVGGEEPLDAPIVPERPNEATSIDAVATVVGTCEPYDIVANRLDPWHGAWFHPYSFTRLDVLSSPPVIEDGDSDDRFLVAVTFRLGGRIGVPVKAEFTSPDPRTVVMRIVEGEGIGSVVETHATPLGPGPDGLPRTAVIEAVAADSARPGFAVARKAQTLLRPLMRRSAARLWRDDLDYAERRYLLRAGHV